ncbi:XrtA-associated tyrosine autokinase [Pleionea sp. CnH1-48]|uniref:XrtA-associated tyrosine autokinase n=1 Tax=Pleionea sp. CnH1-48 TaxID=2954494 RepID=UPI002098638C|nr:XrtA-associated tyrosine autokinase [Pleionea sp. CnH1-48]MCO7226254.1 XrtA-associated tyrosine autokinase [Pleionea sp. CnH1-48]
MDLIEKAAQKLEKNLDPKADEASREESTDAHQPKVESAAKPAPIVEPAKEAETKPKVETPATSSIEKSVAETSPMPETNPVHDSVIDKFEQQLEEVEITAEAAPSHPKPPVAKVPQAPVSEPTSTEAEEAKTPEDKQPDAAELKENGPRSNMVEDDDGIIKMTLDMDYLHAMSMVVPDDSRSKIKEEYRLIKRPLLLNAAGKGNLKSDHGNLVMVTSSNPNEGKTFTAINLAMSIAAERDKTVLLVDCDVIRPSVARFFGLDPETKGLTDYLTDKATLNEVIVRTDFPTLRMITSGKPHHLSNELLASGKMEQLMHELSKRYSDRIIILDSPPLLTTTEAGILSTHVGQIVIVVEADNTKREELEQSIERLNLKDEIAIGLVLNKSQRQMDSHYYGYGYESD